MEPKRHHKYFEGIMQLRNPNEAMLELIENEFANHGKPAISKEVKIKDGYDFYFISKKFMVQIARKLKDKFPVLMKTSATLQTTKMGKELYRTTVLIRRLKFKKGDVAKVAEDKFEVIAVMNNQVATKNLKSGAKKRFSIEEFEKYV